MSLYAIAPALPLHAAGKYVAGAYIVFIAVILIYVTIMAIRLTRTERALVELNREIAARENQAHPPGAAQTPVARGDEAAAGVNGGERRGELDRETAPAGRPGDSPL